MAESFGACEKNTDLQKMCIFKHIPSKIRVNPKLPLVSFIIAAYNEESYIEECITSCINQTYSNVEICITDDGSTDNTWNIINKYYSNNPAKNLKIDRFHKNKGKIAAFNNSFAMSSGD